MGDDANAERIWNAVEAARKSVFSQLFAAFMTMPLVDSIYGCSFSETCSASELTLRLMQRCRVMPGNLGSAHEHRKSARRKQHCRVGQQSKIASKSLLISKG